MCMYCQHGPAVLLLLGIVLGTDHSRSTTQVVEMINYALKKYTGNDI